MCIQVLNDLYPQLLDSSRPQKVEIFVPLNHDLIVASVVGGINGSGSDLEESSDPLQGGCGSHQPASPLAALYSSSNSNSPLLKIIGDMSASGATPPSGSQNPLYAASSPTKTSGSDGSPSSPHSTASPPTNGHGGGGGRPAKLSDHSWEVVSRYSTTSNRLSILQDSSNPQYNLVPLWECLQVSPSPPPLSSPPPSFLSSSPPSQEAFKTPVIRVEADRLVISHIIPDLLFADLPPELLFRSKVSSPDYYLMSLEDCFFGGVAPPPPEATGMFIQSYYSFNHDDVFVRKPAGALKAVKLIFQVT